VDAVTRTRLVEQVEAEAMFMLLDGAPADVKARLGITTARLGGGVVLSMRNDPMDHWSKAVGFDVPVTADLVAEICAFYRSMDAPLGILQFAPGTLPENWAEIVADEHLTPGSTVVKLVRDGKSIAPVDTGLKVGRVAAEQMDAWVDTYMRGFEIPEGDMARLLSAPFGHPDVRAYGAWDGDDIVGAAVLFVHGEAAQFAGAATLPSHRGRGAQSALTALRLTDGVESGVEWFSVETGRPAPGEQNPSLNNLRRLGFDVLYDRQSWLWRP
jgi:hypothetical protein